MSNSDGLTSIYFFKTAEDGRRLFFPWGSLGSGYVISSEKEFERLRGHVERYILITIIILLVSVVAWYWWRFFGGPVALLRSVMLPLVVVTYAVWAHSQCRPTYIGPRRT